MPVFALSCIDKADSLDLRMATRPAHLEYIQGLGAAVRVAGPYLDEAGTMCGSLILLEAADLAAARKVSEADPYARAGLFERVEIRPFRMAVVNG